MALEGRTLYFSWKELRVTESLGVEERSGQINAVARKDKTRGPYGKIRVFLWKIIELKVGRTKRVEKMLMTFDPMLFPSKKNDLSSVESVNRPNQHSIVGRVSAHSPDFANKS